MDAPLFREIMASFPSGVVVVTAMDAERRPRGLTVSAFCPVSLDPPLILVCVDRSSNTLPAIQASGGFTVNILSAGRQEIAKLMASKVESKFDAIEWTAPELPEGGPVLHADIVAHAVCRVERALEAGDHWIFVGHVDDGGVSASRSPLLYSRRAFLELGG